MPRIPFAMSALAAALTLAACHGESSDVAPASAFQAELRMTHYGVPHVRADNFASLGFGVAQAYLKDNLCALADQVVTVNGERSKFFGPQANAIVSFVPMPNRESDFFYKSYLDDAALAEAFTQASPEVRELLRGYIAGYNEFLQKPGDTRHSCSGAAWLRPIALRDFLRLLGDKAVLAGGASFARAIAAAQPSVSVSGTALRVRPASLDRDVVLAQLNPYVTRGAASNAYGVGAAGTGTGAGMLLGNPHWPWFGNNQFFQVHMTVPGQYDVFGVMNGDFPLPLIGFNKDVAWTHTVSPALRQTLFELSLVPGNPTQYLVDGQVRQMSAREIKIEVKQPDGSLVEERRTMYASHLGPIVQTPSLVPGGVNLVWDDRTAYTLRDANVNSMRLLDQWLAIGRATRVAEVEAALRQVGANPYVHTVAADRHGQALYADIGAVPNVPRAKLQAQAAGGCVKGATAQAVLALVNLPILDAARSACDWDVDAAAVRPGLMPTARLPAVTRSDYVANSNQSAWFVHPQARIDDLEPVLGGAVAPLSLRQRLAFTQMEERLAAADGLSAQPGFHSLELMRRVLFGNRLMAAELSIAGKASSPPATNLLSTCQPEAGSTRTLVMSPRTGQTVDIAPACQLLQDWDGRANLDSRGAVLFREFWRRLRMPPGTPLWLTPFDPADPVHTPRDLNVQAGMARDTLRATLADTVADLQAKGLDFRLPLGQLQGVTRAGQRIALHGGDEFEGIFNKITMRENNTSVPLTGAGYTDVFSGSSYIQAVTWVNGVVTAQGVLAYSQATEASSPHFSDQTAQLYAKSAFTMLPFSAADIAAQQVGTTLILRSRTLRDPAAAVAAP
jgi:acyl-homoserine-lactone acylase